LVCLIYPAYSKFIYSMMALGKLVRRKDGRQV